MAGRDLARWRRLMSVQMWLGDRLPHCLLDHFRQDLADRFCHARPARGALRIGDEVGHQHERSEEPLLLVEAVFISLGVDDLTELLAQTIGALQAFQPTLVEFLA
jgi:hypothetical protein